MYKNNETNSLKPRLATDALLVAAFCWFPWWVSLGAAMVAFFYFNDFIELIILGAMVDALYAPHQSFAWLSYRYTLAYLVIFFVLDLVKRQLR